MVFLVTILYIEVLYSILIHRIGGRGDAKYRYRSLNSIFNI